MMIQLSAIMHQAYWQFCSHNRLYQDEKNERQANFSRQGKEGGESSFILKLTSHALLGGNGWFVGRE